MGNSRKLNLQLLKDYKDEILKAEIGALLFNLGKTHVGFWEEKEGKKYFQVDRDSFCNIYGFRVFSNYKDYYFNNIFVTETKLYHLEDFFNRKVELPFKVEGKQELEWIEIFRGSASQKDFIKKIFFRGCENINSGIDKGSPNKQLEPPLWLSNAFGSFKKKVEEKDFDNRRLCFFSNLAKFLSKNNYFQSPDWKEIRNFILEEIKDWYSKLLSDSRFPANDVSLFDQAYMTTSMFKAVLSLLVMDKNLEDVEKDKYFKSPSSIKWRILGIQYDKLGLAEKGYKPAQIQWYRETAKKIDEEIKRLLECEYPIGNEIYRDETGIYFIIGEDLGEDLNSGSNLAKLKSELKEIENKILEIFKRETNDEFYPAIFLTKASRGLMNLTYLLEEAKNNFLQTKWNKKNSLVCLCKDDRVAIAICEVCKCRFTYRKAREINEKIVPEGKPKSDDTKRICDVCYREKTQGRIEKWLENRHSETIWTTELKDKNDRISCISLKFELQNWLKGNLLNSLITQNLQFPISLLCNNWEELYNQIKADIKTNRKINETCLRNYHVNIPNLGLKQIIENWFLERSIGQAWEEFIYKQLNDWDSSNKRPLKQKINFDDRKIYWSKLNDNDIEFLSILLLQFLLRKNPSPARLRRIWENTREFFEKIEKDIMEITGIPDDRCIRLYWDGINSEEGEYWSGNLEFWVLDRKAFLITYDSSIIENYRNGNDFEFKLERKNKKSSLTLKLKDAKVETYKPYMSIIDPTPVSWQFIIPAEYVPNLIDKVLERYNENFKYVYGKLPLHIGIVIQDYKRPLYVGLNALRRIRRDVKNTEDLWLSENAGRFCIKYKKKSSYATPEELCNKTEDYYSLYWENPNEKGYLFYIKPEEKWKKWISTLDKFNPTDKVQYIPNTFDFEFLDTNTRRNDIYYSNGKRAKKLKANRPYEVEEYWEKFKIFKKIFSDKTSSSKLHKLISLLYSKLDGEEFDKRHSYLLSSAFVNILELKKNEELRNGIFKIFEVQNFKELTEKMKEEKNVLLFLDMFEFWHTALKEV